MRRTLPAIALLAAISATGLTACTTTDTPTPSTRPAPTTPDRAPADSEPATDADDIPALGQDDITEVAVRMTWDGTSEADRDAMCAGLDMFGHQWAVDQLRNGGGTDADLNWNYAAELIQTECDQR